MSNGTGLNSANYTQFNRTNQTVLFLDFDEKCVYLFTGLFGSKGEKSSKNGKKPRNFVVFQVFHSMKAGIADAKLVPSRLQQAIK